ncbi:hypothetical protein NE236_16710 [Actinoallomurus purpureus]|uniref:hypothetical protein n=1 Tax=Actinoallomurus purpureus TaxID=478114 RepID=UPI002092C184|nr:hypothetical protein [Actinoallomurus purpureus]MCO6006628.1 hypothetical protein [Actinoallomurus purpureus]
MKEQVQETVSELPIHAARLAVMGVGQALLLTDRVRKDYKEARESGLGPVLGRLRDDAEDLTGRLVGKVTGRSAPDGGAGEGGAPTPASSEIAVGKPGGAGRTRPAASRTKPSTAAQAKPAPATGKPSSRAKGAAAPASRPGTAERQAKITEAKPTGTKTTEAKPAKPAPAPKPAPARPEKTTTPTAEKPATAAPAKETPPPSAPAEEKTSPATGTRPAGTTAAAAAPAKEEKPAPAEGTAASAPAPKAEAARNAGTTAPSTAPASGDELPIPDYDHASIASVRARLRNLNVRQVNELRDYERAHSARAEFLRMYENRIAKLRSGD